jgi:hypothetical protein
MIGSRPVPHLSRHRHLHPADGTCLMEWVSILAGEDFSDSPGCTHPLLAYLARIVNDTVDETARQHLIRWAPSLTGAAGHGYLTSRRIVAACATVAVDAGVGDRRIRRAASAETGTMDGARGRGISAIGDRWYRRGPARHLLNHVARRIMSLPPADRDQTMCLVLEAAIVVTTGHRPAAAPRRASR